MDIRGIEVTNQLRSAIRAKLLELGVRYDEELPDYILVMVVNKKSRQQMHEDLHLFLEKNTAPFVEWLHDQVLKKLQKVTIAKKKATREFVPAVIIKQEEQRKKHKTLDEESKKLLGKPLKEDKDIENEVAKTEPDTENNQTEIKEPDSKKCSEPKESLSKSPVTISESENIAKKVELVSYKSNESLSKSSKSQNEPGSSKLVEELVINPVANSRIVDGKRPRNLDQEGDIADSDPKKLKSSITKPRITSVVSIKTRLGIISPKKKLDVHSERDSSFNKHKHTEERHYEPSSSNRNNFSRPRNAEFSEDSRRSRNFDPKTRDKKTSEKSVDVRNRLGNLRESKPNPNPEVREKITCLERPAITIKNRLGSSNSNRTPPESSSKKQDIQEERRTDSRLERSHFRGKNVKYRLGPMRNSFRPVDNRNSFNNLKSGRDFKEFSNSKSGREFSSLKSGREFSNLKSGREFSNLKSGREFSKSARDFSNFSFENDLDEDDETNRNNAPVKSHIVAVQKPSPEKSSRKRGKSDDEISDAEEEVADCKVPSKVIVTPRPLKPLPSIQKRATQSLLLRAVAEANQSVVSQKNPEPSLVETKSPPMRQKPSGSWTGGQNLSVHLNSQKRIVMENIQIELTTVSNNDTKCYDSHEVTDEHIGVVRSLFQQSNNDQKFLVTLNGYNNNLPQQKSSDENEENLEMELNESDEQGVSFDNSNSCQENESDATEFRVSNIEEDDKEDNEDNEDIEDNESNNSNQSNNDENQNTENINDADEPPKKARKLSPIVYNKSRSPTPEISTSKISISSVVVKADKKYKTESVSVSLNTLIDEKCRYWPNCTLGKKCAYFHPDILCSLFPACKFGENCQYLHPKCKFGLACKKVGCIFSHPAEKCKYHPYCTNPSCTYSHPSTTKPTLLTSTSRRAKFTWRRQN